MQPDNQETFRRGASHVYMVLWYGMVWYGMVWYGMVWYGMVWYGMVWYGMVSYGIVWYRMVSYGMVRYDIFIFQTQYKVISKQKIASKMLPYCQWKASAI